MAVGMQYLSESKRKIIVLIKIKHIKLFIEI